MASPRHTRGSTPSDENPRNIPDSFPAKQLEAVLFKFQDPLVPEPAQLAGHRAAVDRKVIGELLAVIGNRKTQRSGLMDEAVKESKELFAGGALGDDFQFLIEKDITIVSSRL